MSPHTSAVLVAAGRGTRMGPGIDKLFLELAGRPVIAHTWQRYDQCPVIDELILVVRDGMQEAFEEIAQQLKAQKPWRWVIGGAERQDSVERGLQAVSPGVDVVAIQDGARPCTASELIERCVAAAREMGASVAAQRVTDTIKESENGATIGRHLDRSRLWAVQTPQCFRLDTIRRALREVQSRGLRVTDDTAACELIGQPVRLIESTIPNPKVTLPEDVPWIESLLERHGPR